MHLVKNTASLTVSRPPGLYPAQPTYQLPLVRPLRWIPLPRYSPTPSFGFSLQTKTTRHRSGRAAWRHPAVCLNPYAVACPLTVANRACPCLYSRLRFSALIPSYLFAWRLSSVSGPFEPRLNDSGVREKPARGQVPADHRTKS